MADKEHFELVMSDVDAWNEWREDNPKVNAGSVLCGDARRGSDAGQSGRARSYAKPTWCWPICAARICGTPT